MNIFPSGLLSAEATLQKLRHGARRAFASTEEGGKCEMSATATSAHPEGGDGKSTVKLKQEEMDQNS